MNFLDTMMATALALAAALGLGDEQPRGRPAEQPVARMVVEQGFVMRVPVAPTPPAPPTRVHWTEHKGPKCVDGDLIRGARLSGPTSIDLVMVDRTRLRAEMDSKCTALDFYGGFYVESKDDRICARREMVRSRMGSTCRIEKFKSLRLAVDR